MSLISNYINLFFDVWPFIIYNLLGAIFNLLDKNFNTDLLASPFIG